MSAVATSNIKPELLARYAQFIQTNPILAKSATTGTLYFLQEIIASHLAGIPTRVPKSASPITKVLALAKYDIKAVKLGLYGFFVHAPLGHFLAGILQKVFAGKTSALSKLLFILANNLFVAPIQTAAYVTAVALISGARTKQQVIGALKQMYLPILKVTWVSSPLAVIFAQKFITPELWVPFFSLFSFTLGTAMNASVKKAKLRALAKKAREDKEKLEKSAASNPDDRIPGLSAAKEL